MATQHREHWQALKRLVWARCGGKCERCGNTLQRGSHHLHHKTYARRGHELPEDVEYICLICHGLAHPDHTFRSVQDQQQIARRRKRNGEKKICGHCGNSWPRARHQAICVRFGLDVPQKRIKRKWVNV